MIRSLQANPLTAPYAFATDYRNKQVLLYGRVGTKQIHDEAIQTAIALGVPIVDNLVIDTAAAHQAAGAMPPPGYATSPAMAGVSGYPGAGAGVGMGTQGSLPYTYPPPLLGRLDDPFFGFEPPGISYPPWWGAMTDRRLGLSAYPMPPGAQAGNTAPPNSSMNPGPGANPGTSRPIDATGNGANDGSNIPDGTIDMAIDPRGVATLRGNVPTLQDRISIGQQIAKTPGVTQVVNLLNIKAMPADHQ